MIPAGVVQHRTGIWKHLPTDEVSWNVRLVWSERFFGLFGFMPRVGVLW
jgi:hypothetical protein